MAAKSDKLPDVVRDAIARVAATGLSDQQIHERAGLSSGWLSQLRAGRYAPAAPSFRKLVRFLDRLEAGADAGKVPVEKQPGVREVIAAVVAGATGGGSPDLAARIRRAATFREVKECERELVAVALEVGDPMPASLDLAAKVLKSLKDTIKREREEENDKALNALEVLTPDEQAVLAEHRKKVAGPPVQPGEYVRPPEGGS
jgi:transcriptional regulator with XRE-family HTH domain